MHGHKFSLDEDLCGDELIVFNPTSRVSDIGPGGRRVMKFRGIYNRAMKKLVVVVVVTLYAAIIHSASRRRRKEKRRNLVYLAFVRFIPATGWPLLFLPVSYSGVSESFQREKRVTGGCQ